jgi:hypothetical protein
VPLSLPLRLHGQSQHTCVMLVAAPRIVILHKRPLCERSLPQLTTGALCWWVMLYCGRGRQSDIQLLPHSPQTAQPKPRPLFMRTHTYITTHTKLTRVCAQ